MKVVLLTDIKKLGKRSEIVEVSDGYARNMLIKKGVAVEATASNLNDLKLKLKNEEKVEKEKYDNALREKSIIESKEISLKIKAGSNGKTFGSITAKEISDAIKISFNVDVEKKKIDVDEAIKNIGVYNVKIKLHRDVEATLSLRVMEE